MNQLYVWLKFIHLAFVMVFLFSHGISAGTSFVMRGAVSGSTRTLLTLSQRSAMFSTPSLLVILITGIWMTFAGHWSGMVWPWAALGALLVVTGVMFYVARPYYLARDAIKDSDAVLGERLGRTNPILAAWIGVIGLLAILFLMVFKPF